MQRLIYTSVASENLGQEGLFEIIETSARNNPSRELTGFLIFNNQKFFQMVEGPARQIADLLAVLHDDRRHHSIEILDRSDVPGRLFEKWRMKRLAGSNSKAILDALEIEAGSSEGARDVFEFASEFVAGTKERDGLAV
ncbi:MAG: BLUF domain-containing protein [Pseudomonadota bacterium]